MPGIGLIRALIRQDVGGLMDSKLTEHVQTWHPSYALQLTQLDTDDGIAAPAKGVDGLNIALRRANTTTGADLGISHGNLSVEEESYIAGDGPQVLAPGAVLVLDGDEAEGDASFGHEEIILNFADDPQQSNASADPLTIKMGTPSGTIAIVEAEVHTYWVDTQGYVYYRGPSAGPFTSFADAVAAGRAGQET